MMTREDYVKQVWKWCDPKTPFRHEGRVRGPKGGVDCIGLVIGPGVECGLESCKNAYTRVRNYSRIPDGVTLVAKARAYMETVVFNPNLSIDDQLCVGDVFVFWIDKPGIARHLGIYAGLVNDIPYMLHSYEPRGGAVAMPFTGHSWRRRIIEVFRIPEFC